MGVKAEFDPTTRDVGSKPGPGNYEPPVALGTRYGPKTIFGTASRSKSQARNGPQPGPGSYTLEGQQPKETAPSFGFGTSTRDKINK